MTEEEETDATEPQTDKIRDLYNWIVKATNACNGVIAGAAVDDKMVELWPWLEAAGSAPAAEDSE